MNIRRATPSDATAVATIIVPIIRDGTTYTLDPDMSELQALAYWMGRDKETFVAEQDGVVLGTHYMRPNQAGGGRHVCLQRRFVAHLLLRHAAKLVRDDLYVCRSIVARR
jgi:hypothetical protein